MPRDTLKLIAVIILTVALFPVLLVLLPVLAEDEPCVARR